MNKRSKELRKRENSKMKEKELKKMKEELKMMSERRLWKRLNKLNIELLYLTKRTQN